MREAWSRAFVRPVWVAVCGFSMAGFGCRPDDANLGGTWSCPAAAVDSCFHFDSGLAPQSNDVTLALFNVAEDPDPANAPRIASRSRCRNRGLMSAEKLRWRSGGGESSGAVTR